MAYNYMIVSCPRCGRALHVPMGQPDVDCNCHLVCPDGSVPSDCSVTAQTFSGNLGWPTGLNNHPADEGHDVLHRTYYCSTHSKYYYKTPIIIDVDWGAWLRSRAPKKFRMSRGMY